MPDEPSNKPEFSRRLPWRLALFHAWKKWEAWQLDAGLALREAAAGALRLAGFEVDWRWFRVQFWTRIGPLLAVFSLLLLGYVLFHDQAWEAIQRAKADRFVWQAEASAGNGQLDRAAFAARKALELNPRHLGATRMMARLTERVGSPTTLVWHFRLVDITQTWQSRLAAVRVALRYESPPYTYASQTIASIPSQDRNSTEYHLVAAEVAVQKNELAQAEVLYQEALRRDPKNDSIRFAWQTTRLASTNAAVVEEARYAVEDMARFPPHREPGLRSLREYFRSKGQLAEACKFSSALLLCNGKTFLDELRHLELLRADRPEEFAASLRQALDSVPAHPQRRRPLLNWLLFQELAPEAETWIRQWPVAVSHDPELRRLVVETKAKTEKWEELLAWLRAGNWGKDDYHRRALLVKTMRAGGQPADASREWAALAREAELRLAWLEGLIRLGSAWEWWPEVKQCHWLIIRGHQSDPVAVGRFHQFLARRADTPALIELYQYLAEANPKNFDARNNLSSLLLLADTPPDRAHQWAKEVHEARPGNPNYTATYAFSLYRQGRAAEALQTMKDLRLTFLRSPVIAGYYALILADQGEKVSALKYLDWVQERDLLKEEKRWVQIARDKARQLPWPEEKANEPK